MRPNTQRARQVATAAVLSVAAFVTGCVEQNPTALQFIGNAVVLRQPGGGQGQLAGTCIADQAQFYRPFGTLDIMIANQYDIFPEMVNNLQPTGTVSGNGIDDLRADASTIIIQGAEVTMRVRRDADGPYAAQAALPSPNWTRQVATDGSNAQYFTRTAYMPSARSLKSNESKIIRFPLIPPEFGEDLRRAWFTDDATNFPDRYTTQVPTVIVFQVEGRMADGTMVRSAPVEYSVNLCWGCLLYLNSTNAGVEDVDPVNIFQNCSQKGMFAAGGEFTPPCLPGNDEALPCGFYCSMCQANESLEGDVGAEYKCDRRFCPLPP